MLKQINAAALTVWRHTNQLQRIHDDQGAALQALRDAEVELAILMAKAQAGDLPDDEPDEDEPDHWLKLVGAQTITRQVDKRLWDEFEVNSGDRLSNTRFHNMGWTGMHHSKGAGVVDDFVCEHVHLDNGQKWLSRAYRMRGAPTKPIVQRNCSLTNCATEHGYYWNLAGGGGFVPWLETTAPEPDQIALLFEYCLFQHIGSQAMQFVGVPGREAETPDPEGDAEKGGVIVVRRCLFEDIGWNHGGSARASYALSFFESPHDVFIDEIVVDNSMSNPDPLAMGKDMDKGALLIEASGINRRAVVINSEFRFNKTDRSLGNFKDLDELVIQGCHFEADGGQAWLSLKGCKNVVITGCTGNVRIKVDGTDVGSIGDGYQTVTA